MPELLDRLKTALTQRYALQRELGAGGMATVYLAEDLKHHRKVAVKVLRPELAAILGTDRFLKEIQVTANLQHPHILALHDSGEADSFLYYVMPFVEGESLRDRLNRDKQLGVDEAIEIAKGVAAALDYAHRQGVIHRDIKPENILIHDGQPVVADFGIALAVTTAGGTRLTETGLSLGTPQYMSPEQATGERVVTATSDVYSLGAVVYEMLVGDPPHTGSTVQAIIAKVMAAEPQPITDLRRNVPVNVEAAVQRALAKVPADRFGTAREFAEALVNPNYSLPSSGRAIPSRATPIWKGPAAVIAAVGVLSTATAYLAGSVRGRDTRPPRSVARFEINPTDITVLEHVAISNDGEKIVFEGQDRSGTNQLFLRSLDGRELLPIPGTEGATNPFFSPDGLTIGFLQSGALKTLRLDGGVPVVLVSGGGFVRFGGADWAPDDVIVLTYGASGGGVFTVPPTGGTPALVSQRQSGDFGDPHLLPDGAAVLITLYDRADTSLAVVSLRDGSVTPLNQRGKAPHYVDGGFLAFVDQEQQLVASRFDLASRRLVGPPQPMGATAFGAVWRPPPIAVSRNGTVVFRPTGESFRDLVIMDLEGRIEVLPLRPDRYGAARFAPDGETIVVEILLPDARNQADLWLYDVNRTTLSRLTSDLNSRFPRWAWDGRAIFYSSNRGRSSEGWTTDLYSISPDGGEPVQLLSRQGPQWEVYVMADGRSMVFMEFNTGTGQDILTATVGDSASVHPLVQSRAAESSVQVSPNEQWLAFVSSETGESQVYVQPITDSVAKALVSTAGGTAPRWRGDGRALFYVNGDSILVVSLGPDGKPDGRPELALVAPSAATYYDVHPDGQRFVIVRESPGRREGLEVIMHWFDDRSQ